MMTEGALLFDTHAHVLSADLERYPYSTLRGGARPPVSPLVFSVEELVRELDAGGVAHACIVQRATLYGYDNRYALDAAAAFPGRFVPVVVLDAQDPASPGQLRALAAAHRLGGLRIVAPQLTETDTAWLDGAEALGLWRSASALALPVTVILYRRNNEAGLAALLGIARKFRDLQVSDKELAPLQQIDDAVRQIQAPELVDDAVRVEPIVGRGRRRQQPLPAPEAAELVRSDPDLLALVETDILTPADPQEQVSP